ncbi:MAG TPA: hypothetical protein VGU68_04760, partial [Ktedonobacteraceae bacterium]|nr:hypothetical protein [Ktedonobacteraceae bacterium]
MIELIGIFVLYLRLQLARRDVQQRDDAGGEVSILGEEYRFLINRPLRGGSIYALLTLRRGEAIERLQ